MPPGKGENPKMLEFLAGLLAGGVVGVICDRLWQKVEKRVRLRVQGGGHEGVRGEGISFRVKNEGKERLPPIRLCLFSPNIGSYYVFPPETAELNTLELWPGQERAFLCIVSPEPLPPNPIWKMIARGATDRRLVFRVQPVDGDTVMFQSRRIGKALACIFAQFAAGTPIGHIGGGLWGDLSYEPGGPLAWIRRKLYLRAILKEAACHSQNPPTSDKSGVRQDVP